MIIKNETADLAACKEGENDDTTNDNGFDWIGCIFWRMQEKRRGKLDRIFFMQ